MTEHRDTDLETTEQRAIAYDQLRRRADESGFPSVNDALDELDALRARLGLASKE